MGDCYRDQLAIQRRNNQGHKKPEATGSVRTVCEERRALRSQWFKKKAQGYSKTPAHRRIDG